MPAKKRIGQIDAVPTVEEVIKVWSPEWSEKQIKYGAALLKKRRGNPDQLKDNVGVMIGARLRSVFMVVLVVMLFVGIYAFHRWTRSLDGTWSGVDRGLSGQSVVVTDTPLPPAIPTNPPLLP